MSMKMTMAEFVSLEPCPFCGSGWLYEVRENGYCDETPAMFCNSCKVKVTWEQVEEEGVNDKTKAFVREHWNSRAPIEYNDWFYLPKPKEGIVQYGAPYAEEVENGYKIKQTVEVIESAIRSWGDELGDYVMKRICEVWNSRAERTCEFNIKDNMNETEGMGDVWIECSTCHCVYDYFADDWLMKMSYCPNCGAKVVGE